MAKQSWMERLGSSPALAQATVASGTLAAAAVVVGRKVAKRVKEKEAEERRRWFGGRD